MDASNTLAAPTDVEPSCCELPSPAKEETDPLETPSPMKEEKDPAETAISTKEESDAPDAPSSTEEERDPPETSSSTEEERDPPETPSSTEEEREPPETPTSTEEERDPPETPLSPSTSLEAADRTLLDTEREGAPLDHLDEERPPSQGEEQLSLGTPQPATPTGQEFTFLEVSGEGKSGEGLSGEGAPSSPLASPQDSSGSLLCPALGTGALMRHMPWVQGPRSAVVGVRCLSVPGVPSTGTDLSPSLAGHGGPGQQHVPQQGQPGPQAPAPRTGPSPWGHRRGGCLDLPRLHG